MQATVWRERVAAPWYCDLSQIGFARAAGSHWRQDHRAEPAGGSRRERPCLQLRRVRLWFGSGRTSALANRRSAHRRSCAGLRAGRPGRKLRQHVYPGPGLGPCAHGEETVKEAALGNPVDYINIEGMKIAYRRAGEGPPLVLLHGGPTHSGEFRQQLEGLADQFSVVAWDMPGCGQSSDPPEHFRIRDYVACLADFIAALGLEQTHVLGLSFGTGLALELYRAHPELVRSLILVSAYAGWAGSLPPEVVAQRKQRMQHMIELRPEAWVREWLPTLLTDSAAPEVVEELK